MNILVFSDSHTDVELMQAITQREKPDALIHLGDHYRDAVKLSGAFPGLAVHRVLGNCDYGGEGEEELLLTLEGKRLLLAHGHRYSVKAGLSAYRQRARALGVDAALFGHTHRPLLESASGTFLCNPGHIGRLHGGCAPSFARLRIEKKDIRIDIIEVPFRL